MHKVSRYLIDYVKKLIAFQDVPFPRVEVDESVPATDRSRFREIPVRVACTRCTATGKVWVRAKSLRPRAGVQSVVGKCRDELERASDLIYIFD